MMLNGEGIDLTEPCKVCAASEFQNVLTFKKCFFSDGSEGKESLVKEECLKCATVRTQLAMNLKEFYEINYQPSRNIDTVAIADNEKISRSEFVYHWIKDLASTEVLESFDSVLEIGCGQGYLLEKFQIANKYGVEPSMEASDVASTKATIRQIGYEEISDSERYDFTLSYCVIEHVENPSLFIEKNFNILNTNGTMCIALPIQDKFNYDLVFADHIHHFSHKNFVTLLNNCGFDIVSYELGRGSYSNIGMYICKKRVSKQTREFHYVKNNNIENINKIFKNLDNILKVYKNEPLYAFGYGEIAKTILPYTDLDQHIIAYVDDYNKGTKILTSKKSISLFHTMSKVNLVLLINPAHIKRIIDLYDELSNVNFINIFEEINTEYK